MEGRVKMIEKNWLLTVLLEWHGLCVLRFTTPARKNQTSANKMPYSDDVS
jgi:hypothetical protein